ncbi:MAG: 2Fe-2S iron-sulfur cluster binding domain-containing protein [Acholeplasmataceae bacterium]|nr:2Fe-2S iron-sulfur cluster binding domain-containing protein [Acholeplasmataceae bacterium]
MNLLFVPIVLIGVLLVIAGILIVVEKLLGGNKEKVIQINEDKIIPVSGDETVLNTLSQHKIFIPSACGGKATCGFCKFKLIEGGGEIKATEIPFLSKEEQAEGIRLSCQVKVRDNMKIEIPNELLNAKEYVTRVSYIEDLTYDIKLVRFELIEPKEMIFKPGQYAQLKVPGIDVIRAYSIASHPKKTGEIELIIRQVPKGLATTFVHKALEVGDKVILTGPYGDFYLQEESNRDMICIAGGSGKAPIRSILYYLRDQGMNRKVKYFFGAKSKRDLYYTEEFMELSKEFPNFEYIPALSEPLQEDTWDGETGLITEVVDRHVDDLSECEAYLCGSPGMIKACIQVLNKHQIKQENVFFDSFS